MRKKIAATILLSLLGAFQLNTVNAQAFNLNMDNYNYTTYANEFFVAVNGLRVRSTPADNGKVMGMLSLNERVRVLSPELINGKYVEIEILETVNNMLPAERYYVVQEFLSNKMIDYKEFTGKYFVVVNIATETLRLYERVCPDNTCPNKMIMETEVVVGEDRDHEIAEKGKGRSIVGSYRVTGWAKFYEDSEGHYPAWYKDGYPMPPAIGENDWKDWFKKEVMPVPAPGKDVGSMRGAFGWYAAFVAPNAYGQWTHGTVGWGEDKDEYIKKTKKFLINVVSNPRSSGCTRNNNESIAFLRQVVETGTPIIKIYAREALMDPSLSKYRQPEMKWNYIMTKNAGQKAGRTDVLKAMKLTDAEVDAYWSAKRSRGYQILDPKSPLNQILEVGTYTLDTRPDPIEFQERKKILGKWRDTKRTGNVYGLKKEEMSPGVYYVDSGFLYGYRHPKAKIEVSGFMDEETPPWMDARLLRR